MYGKIYGNGKDTLRNNLYKNDSSDARDKGVNGIKVTLKEYESKDSENKIVGEDVATTTTSELGKYNEIDGGEYIFTNVEITKLSNYYIEYEYNGMKYKSVILKDTKIGDNVIIGANSLVNKDIHSGTVWAGNPIRYICTLNEYYEKKPSNDYMLTSEQSYIENILRNNIGKRVRVHASFSDSVEWRDRVFTGVIEHAGRDNLVINDKENGKNYLILMIYLNFVEFDEEITYAK